MRTIKYYMIILAAMTLSACDDFLSRDPLSELIPGTFFSNKSDMDTWTAGIYDALQSTLDEGHLEWGDLRSDNYNTTGYGDSKVYMNAIDASLKQYSWQSLYQVINRCNTAIERFPTIPGLGEKDYNDYLGQAYGLRALAYFYAIRVWGDAPLTASSWEGDVPASYIPRSSVAEIKVQIISDLEQAMGKLGNAVKDQRKFYFNMAAAHALKTDVHMWFHEYPEALAASDYFVGNENYAMVADKEKWKEIFMNPTTSSETIFCLSWEFKADGKCAWCQRVGASDTNNPYMVSDSIFFRFIDRLNSRQGTDGRLSYVLDTVKLYHKGNKVPLSISHYYMAMGSGIEKSVKFSPIDPNPDPRNPSYWLVLKNADCAVNVQIYRLADILTLRAEALNQLGNGTEALEIVNRIRSRVGYLADATTEVDHSDKRAVEWLILAERQLEFLNEGKRWFDLCRTGRVIEVMDPVLRNRQTDAKVPVTGFGDEGRILCPVYYKEFESNPALRGHQNSPYTEG